MSCGNHHDTPCNEVLEKVWIYIDGEIDASAKHTIKHHLDECAPCLRKFGIEEEVKALVHRSCGSDHAPSDLKDRIRVKLTDVRIDADSITSEHGVSWCFPQLMALPSGRPRRPGPGRARARSPRAVRAADADHGAAGT